MCPLYPIWSLLTLESMIHTIRYHSCRLVEYIMSCTLVKEVLISTYQSLHDFQPLCGSGRLQVLLIDFYELLVLLT